MRGIVVLALSIGVAGALALTACGGGAGGGYGSGGSAAGEGTVVTVKETDFNIELSRDRFSPGTYTFVAKNQGQSPHALEVEGESLEKETETLEPGSTARLTVRLERGSYEVYCPVGHHEERGMSLEIEVT